jgi:hypothetical protein
MGFGGEAFDQSIMWAEFRALLSVVRLSLFLRPSYSLRTAM